MSVTEKMGYLRQLTDGLGLDRHTAETKEEKLIVALIDVIEELTEQIAECEEHKKALATQVEDLAENMDVLESLVLDGMEEEDESFDEYELECPSCGETLVIDAAALDSGMITCPACETKFEIDVGFDDSPETEEEMD